MSTSITRKLVLKNPILSLIETRTNLTELKQIHAHVVQFGLADDQFVISRLIAFCVENSNNLDYANQVFSQIRNPNLYIWNTMIRGYCSSKNPQKCPQLYSQLLHQGLFPDNLTFPFLVKSCTQIQSLERGRETHCQIIKRGFESDIYVQNSLVHMYATCRDIETARRIFHKISRLDIVSWTSMIAGYSKCGDVETARQLFNEMPKRNMVTWSIMIGAYTKNCSFHEALNLFQVLQYEKVKANEAVMVSVISSCANLGALEQGRRAHDYVVRNNLTINLILGTALVDMYAKCGNIHKALELFQELPEKDALSWTTMIGGLAMHRHTAASLEYFSEMLRAGLHPRDVTFTAVLSACSHGGLVEEGFRIFKGMTENYGIKPRLEHYGCMVDLLGRAGKLEEAERFIHRMPVKPNPPIWGALLGACQIHKNVELGKKVGKILIELRPDHSGYYVLLSNIYARANRWGDVMELRKTMKENGVKKSPGYSLTEINGVVHKFIAGDNSHPEIKKIQGKWEEIVRKIRIAGYTENTADVLFDVDEEEKENAIYRHSEKLAIAFGLMKTNPQVPIRIMKNLRVCEDCHTAAKLISEVFDREMIVRDRNRFHHFRSGSCSCMDYW